MDNLALSCDRYTYADYAKWDEDFRCELISGIVYMMASPSEWHQDVVGDVYSQLKASLKGKKCKPMIAPFDVRLFPRKDLSDDTVVQPDVIVICDKSKLDGKACVGAPDVVFEVLSDSTKVMDLRVKMELYKSAGVKEYWVVAKDYAIRWSWTDNRDEELRFMRVNGVISMQVEALQAVIELDV
ncbi:MAG: Uma2 family endonuclease [Treponema sp.]|jgi:Uma2 family endonuclease|nr:Uma2 family endonuclease [Treponema sp.]